MTLDENVNGFNVLSQRFIAIIRQLGVSDLLYLVQTQAGFMSQQMDNSAYKHDTPPNPVGQQALLLNSNSERYPWKQQKSIF